MKQDNKTDSMTMVVLFDPNMGVSFVDHDLDEAVAKSRIERLREQRLPAYTVAQKGEHGSTHEELADCQACRTDFTAALEEASGQKATLTDAKEEEE